MRSWSGRGGAVTAGPDRSFAGPHFEPDRPGPVFWSGQALYKYLPQYDAIFPRIAAELGACRFVFIAFAKSQAVTDAFRNRLWQAFAAAGLDAGQHVVILPPMSQRDYIDAVGRADVILDTIGWSGGKSTLDCLATDPGDRDDARSVHARAAHGGDSAADRLRGDDRRVGGRVRIDRGPAGP